MSSGASWRSATGDIPIRLMIVRRTEEIFRSIQLPCEPDVFDDALSSLVPKLEAELYQRAQSLEEYGDPRTVKQRLERMAPTREGHVRPLEALWLQGLLTRQAPTAAKSPNSAESDQATTTATEMPTPKFTVSLENLPHAPLTTMHPQCPTTATKYTSFDAAEQRARTADDFTHSLVELKKYLDAYDAQSAKAIVVDTSAVCAAVVGAPETTFVIPQGLTLPPSHQAYVQTVGLHGADLICHEGLDEDMEAPMRT